VNELLTGTWWIDAMAVGGSVFTALLALLFPVWHAIDKVRHRRRDAEEIARLMPKHAGFADTGQLKAVTE
jgi:hypothetical protein